MLGEILLKINYLENFLNTHSSFTTFFNSSSISNTYLPSPDLVIILDASS